MSNETATPGPAEPADTASQLRRLVYGDLPAVLAIERRSFQTPWSLAMFVLELSKPSGICLAIPRRGRPGLAGYLVCSRYADVWHLMNIAVAPERRREGIATELIKGLFQRAGEGARFTLEVRTSNGPAIRCTSASGSGRQDTAAATTTTTARTRSSCGSSEHDPGVGDVL